MARRKPSSDDASPQPSFEEALASLEEIIEAMENEQLPLEDLVNQYEKGSQLLDHCEAILQSARERVELITLRNRTEASLPAAGGTPAEPSPPSGRTAAPDDDDDDIRLF
jgi:exodeoxyribonuclease VII small subunit